MYRGGKKRRVSVYKTKQKGNTHSTELSSLPHFTFSEEARSILSGLFANYPPGVGDMWEDKHTDKTEKGKEKKDVIFSRPLMSKVEIAKRLEELTCRMKTDSKLMQVFFLLFHFPFSFTPDRPYFFIMVG